ncbi:YciI family protein [Nocardioides lianchengensis]|uniref:Uncharacterized conserved protein n=1 Tax=Nocardioides lianchengensis TaxID=1045774 RepID=A0A1G6I404_9ACTN|nr:YciI family protein [Nocardioides lianchengensis]NYG13191.1 hypothetical protein [Nocardioides lianchengensis]SDC00785.1 Uncharacterized conserved protein [Nocardioides lianchengensis]
MRFLVLLGGVGHHELWEGAGEATRERMIADYHAFADAVRARGTLVVGDALPPPGRVTDGPFAEAVEQLGGFYVVDLPDLAGADEVARLLPHEHDVVVLPTLGVEV